ncbi:hypothetical protein QQP08_012869 [Theobroma cacao]|nr:hypothetical protein QQP08_012869 [Theobroma cacao]
MGVFTYESEVVTTIPPAKMFKACILDGDKLIPKVSANLNLCKPLRNMPKQLQKNTRNIGKAIQQGFAALDLNPELRMIQKYTAAYLVHKFDSMLCFCQKMKMDDTEVLYSILFSKIVLLLTLVRSKNIIRKWHSWFILTRMIRSWLRGLSRSSVKFGRLLFDHNKRRIA